MGGYANQLKRKYRAFRDDRLMEFLKKTFKTQEAINQALSEMRGPRTWRKIITDPLTKEDQKILFECLKKDSWAEMRESMGLAKKQHAPTATYRFAQLAFRYLRNLK